MTDTLDKLIYPCPTCDGTGGNFCYHGHYQEYHQCYTCLGKGRITTVQKQRHKPPLTEDQARLRDAQRLDSWNRELNYRIGTFWGLLVAIVFLLLAIHQLYILITQP